RSANPASGKPPRAGDRGASRTARQGSRARPLSGSSVVIRQSDDEPDSTDMTGRAIMQPRMTHPAFLIPEAMKGLRAYGAAAQERGVPATTLELVYLPAGQINGCGVCVELHSNELKKAGETDERIF